MLEIGKHFRLIVDLHFLIYQKIVWLILEKIKKDFPQRFFLSKGKLILGFLGIRKIYFWGLRENFIKKYKARDISNTNF